MSAAPEYRAFALAMHATGVDDTEIVVMCRIILWGNYVKVAIKRLIFVTANDCKERWKRTISQTELSALHPKPTTLAQCLHRLSYRYHFYLSGAAYTCLFYLHAITFLDNSQRVFHGCY